MAIRENAIKHTSGKDIAFSVCETMGKDILHLCRNYYYYIVDGRTVKAYELIETRTTNKDTFILWVDKYIRKSVDVFPHLSLVVEDGNLFIIKYYQEIKRKYPLFYEQYKDAIEYVIKESEKM